jgi:putative copper resistance protein D
VAFAIGVGATAVAAGVALPPLVVDAYPTTYQRPPFPYHATSIAAGAELYAKACVACHARDGRDMTSARVARHPAGDLFWWISHGIPGTRMPGTEGRLTEDERWDLVNFVRARGAAEQALRLGPAVGTPPPRIAAPDFSFAVGPGLAQSLRDYRGRKLLVLVLFTLPESRPRLAQLAGAYEALVVMGAEVIAVPTHPAPDILKRLGASPRIFFPVVTEGGPPIVETYGLFRVGPSLPAHMEFLVDRQGYLRARLLPSLDAPPPLGDLLDQLQKLNEEPRTAPPPPDHAH